MFAKAREGTGAGRVDEIVIRGKLEVHLIMGGTINDGPDFLRASFLKINASFLIIGIPAFGDRRIKDHEVIKIIRHQLNYSLTVVVL